ncbi:MAG: protein-L-isoaspartate(D-aspartate) O-methyltransferase [bacterium]|nr:protein-L-isoaspartate(D-aspartate) O-methyltransferase [bacterium]
MKAPPIKTSPPGDGTDQNPGRSRPGAARPQWKPLVGLVAGALLWQASAAAIAQVNSFTSQRAGMVENQVRKRGIEEPAILAAMREVPRHLFLPEEKRSQAYEDVPVVFAPGQTLSQAYLSAQMISLLNLSSGDKVLEIGTGSGYDAAVLSRVAREVYTIEIDESLGEKARRTLTELGYGNVRVKIGDGYRGWSEEAPFDAILITAGAQRIPEPLFEQLKVGGKMVVAVGDFVQDLQVITKTADGRETRRISPVVLVPMEGEVTKDR